MKKAKDFWTPVYEEFVRLYPEMAESVIDWYPSGQMEITVKLKGGKIFEYDWMRKEKIVLYDENKTRETQIKDEYDWRLMFSRKLNHKLYNMAMSQVILALETDISVPTISKYANCKATPSAYNLHKIAKALKCSVSELMD